MRGKTEFGEEYRAVEMVDEYKPKTIPVQVVHRWPDGSEQESHTLHEEVAHSYTTMQEAVAHAVELAQTGVLVKVDHMPDGRSGSSTRDTVLTPSALRAVFSALGALPS